MAKIRYFIQRWFAFLKYGCSWSSAEGLDFYRKVAFHFSPYQRGWPCRKFTVYFCMRWTCFHISKTLSSKIFKAFLGNYFHVVCFTCNTSNASCSPGGSGGERPERHGRHAPAPSGLHGEEGEGLRVPCSVFRAREWSLWESGHRCLLFTPEALPPGRSAHVCHRHCGSKVPRRLVGVDSEVGCEVRSLHSSSPGGAQPPVCCREGAPADPSNSLRGKCALHDTHDTPAVGIVGAFTRLCDDPPPHLALEHSVPPPSSLRLLAFICCF